MPFGKPRSFHKRFKFVVEIDGFGYVGFHKCSELKVTVEVVKQREGGSLIEEKEPGLVTVDNITLERGATQDGDAWNWMKQVVDQNADAGGEGHGLGAGLVTPDYERSADIVQLDRDGTELRRWSLPRTWPCEFVAGDWDNDASENVIEKLTLVVPTFDKTFGV